MRGRSAVTDRRCAVTPVHPSHHHHPCTHLGLLTTALLSSTLSRARQASRWRGLRRSGPTSTSTAVRSRPRNGGELPAKPAPLTSFMLVPPSSIYIVASRYRHQHPVLGLCLSLHRMQLSLPFSVFVFFLRVRVALKLRSLRLPSSFVSHRGISIQTNVLSRREGKAFFHDHVDLYLPSHAGERHVSKSLAGCGSNAVDSLRPEYAT